MPVSGIVVYCMDSLAGLCREINWTSAWTEQIRESSKTLCLEGVHTYSGAWISQGDQRCPESFWNRWLRQLRKSNNLNTRIPLAPQSVRTKGINIKQDQGLESRVSHGFDDIRAALAFQIDQAKSELGYPDRENVFSVGVTGTFFKNVSRIPVHILWDLFGKLVRKAHALVFFFVHRSISLRDCPVYAAGAVVHVPMGAVRAVLWLYQV